MKLSPAVMGAVLVMTLIFALFLVFSVYALIMLFHPSGFSYGKEYFDMLFTQYIGSTVFSVAGFATGMIVLYKARER